MEVLIAFSVGGECGFVPCRALLEIADILAIQQGVGSLFDIVLLDLRASSHLSATLSIRTASREAWILTLRYLRDVSSSQPVIAHSVEMLSWSGSTAMVAAFWESGRLGTRGSGTCLAGTQLMVVRSPFSSSNKEVNGTVRRFLPGCCFP